MPVKQLPSVDYLNKALRYEPDTGLLFWRERPRDHFNSDAAHHRLNCQFAGKEALTALSNGYRIGTIAQLNVRAHRIIWKMMTGCEPDLIDHLDRDKQNNRFANLREASASLNSYNRHLRIGAYIAPNKKKFQLWVKRAGVRHYGGCFDTRAEAEAQRMPFLERLGFADDERLARVAATWYSDTAE